jgi:hypothetical protein
MNSTHNLRHIRGRIFNELRSIWGLPSNIYNMKCGVGEEC